MGAPFRAHQAIGIPARNRDLRRHDPGFSAFGHTVEGDREAAPLTPLLVHAQQHLGEPGWEDILEQNREAMYDAGLWGAPSFRLLDEQGEQLLALWGQDRLWLFTREIQRQLERRKNQ